MKELAARGERWARRNGRSPYAVMNHADICGLDVAGIAARDAVLLMWATYPKLEEAFEVIAAWGFEYKTVGFTWVKTNRNGLKIRLEHLQRVIKGIFSAADSGDGAYVRLAGELVEGWHFGLGYHTRGNPEICLLATRGRGLRRGGNGVQNLLVSALGEHSQKPDEVRERIIRLYGEVPRIELFARQRSAGFEAWGNEAPGGSDVEIGVKPGD
mgnify:CR=1 FL=1